MEQLSANERKHRWVLVGLLSAAFAVTFFLDPIQPLNGKRLCGFLLLTGLPCPTCGMTRAVTCVSHGMFATSVGFHPFGIAVYAIGTTWLAVLMAELGINRRVARPRTPWIKRTLIVFAAIGFIHWAAQISFVLRDDPSALRNSVIYQAIGAER